MSTPDDAPIRTPAERLAMPDDRDRYELIDGCLIERKTGHEARRVGAEICRLLADHEATFLDSWVFDAEVGFCCFPEHPETVLKPDVTVVLRHRVPAEWSPEGHVTFPPDLAVEVLTPEHTAFEVDFLVDLFLDAGVPLLWVANPDLRLVHVHRADGSVNRLREDDELTGENVLHGFSCHVRDLFPI
jgi:Uma2 family endonuclease